MALNGLLVIVLRHFTELGNFGGQLGSLGLITSQRLRLYCQ